VQCTGTPCIYAYYYYIYIYIYIKRVYTICTRASGRRIIMHDVCARTPPHRDQKRGFCAWRRASVGGWVRMYIYIYIYRVGDGLRVVVWCLHRCLLAKGHCGIYLLLLFFLIVHIFRAAALVQRVQYCIYLYTCTYTS